ncbi:DinB family protein [Deinococcus kurensis]|uniref:DinB family protein n=1 Tax=Deinococcus kurensis TaxID=2662757 RepID=UPI0012D2C491|nr:DinB family protein [Deinococcus kurensis]
MNLAAFQEALNARGVEVATFFAALPTQDFTRAAPERWSAAQHLDHLIRSHKVLALALSMPRDRFGWGQRTPPGSRSATELQSAYLEALRGGVKASGRFLPDPQGTQAELVQTYRDSVALLEHHLTAYCTDSELHGATLPHPALGEVTLAETLHFTLYHDLHHLRGVQTALNPRALEIP